MDPFKNHSFLFKEEQKYINKSNKEPLVLPKEKKIAPTSCLWKELLILPLGTLPVGRRGGLLSNPVSYQSPRPEGLKWWG